MEIYAIYLDENGYDNDTKEAREVGLEKGKVYEVDFMDIGQSHSYVGLANFNDCFNSVMFEFEDGEGNEVDIFDTEWNPYR